MSKIKNLTTEHRNPNAMYIDIDIMSTVEMIKTINNEDKKVAKVI